MVVKGLKYDSHTLTRLIIFEYIMDNSFFYYQKGNEETIMKLIMKKDHRISIRANERVTGNFAVKINNFYCVINFTHKMLSKLRMKYHLLVKGNKTQCT